jgi:hypothetical protein
MPVSTPLGSIAGLGTTRGGTTNWVPGPPFSATSTQKAPLIPNVNTVSPTCLVGFGTPAPLNGSRVSVDSRSTSNATATPLWRRTTSSTGSSSVSGSTLNGSSAAKTGLTVNVYTVSKRSRVGHGIHGKPSGRRDSDTYRDMWKSTATPACRSPTSWTDSGLEIGSTCNVVISPTTSSTTTVGSDSKGCLGGRGPVANALRPSRFRLRSLELRHQCRGFLRHIKSQVILSQKLPQNRRLIY